MGVEVRIMSKDLSDFRQGLGHCQKTAPERLHVCQKFLAAHETCLDSKTKELIKVALSVSTQCEWCIAFHVGKALREGASDQEVVDAARMAVLMTGAPALGCMELLRDILAKYKAA
jgi:AhpD family alkylhydroperoxidase